MRILFIVSVPSQEGSNLSLLNLITALQENRHECALLACRSGYLIDHLKPLGVKCKVIRYRASLFPTTRTLREKLLYLPSLVLLLENQLNFKKVATFVDDFSPDIIHTNVSTITIGYKVAKQLNIPHVWHIREYLDLDFNIHPIPSMKCRMKQLADSTTISITEDVRKHFNLNKNSNAHVIYNGILKSSEVFYSSEKKPFFLFAALLQPCKGVYDLLKAYAMHIHLHPDSAYQLKLLGGYTEDVYNLICGFINDNKLDGRVEMPGRVPPEEVIVNMRSAAITFIPSFSEGFGRTMAEAMFNGCLVAGRNTGGTKEQFDNGLRIARREIGLRFNTVEDMADIMNDIFEEGIAKYEEMIWSSQHVVSQLYSIESNYTQIINLYKALSNGRN